MLRNRCDVSSQCTESHILHGSAWAGIVELNSNFRVDRFQEAPLSETSTTPVVYMMECDGATGKFKSLFEMRPTTSISCGVISWTGADRPEDF